MNVECPRCGRAFRCETDGPCWCADMPTLMLEARGPRCMCPTCLRDALQKQKSERLSSDPSGVASR
jgi:Cysteine-rich CWC